MEERRTREAAHCRGATAIQRIQFPQPSIPVCLPSAKIRKEERERGRDCQSWKREREREREATSRIRREDLGDISKKTFFLNWREKYCKNVHFYDLSLLRVS